MKLSRKDVEHIAGLARLDLNDKEMDLYGGQLSDILSFVNQLQEVDTSGVEPTAQVTGLQNIFREDKIQNWDKAEVDRALKQAPGMEDGQVKVKRIL